MGRIIGIGGLSVRQAPIHGLRNLAIVHMMKILLDQLGPEGITGKVIYPGSTQTEGLWQ